MTRTIPLLAAAMAFATLAGPAAAQQNPPAAGAFGAEDGYGGDGFGWGPAYRPQTTFRPSVGFYGGVERPYPYGPAERPSTTGGLGASGRALAPRRAVAPRAGKASAKASAKVSTRSSAKRLARKPTGR